MTSPLDYLREGILDGDWDKVCRAYKGLTGEKLVAPSEQHRAAEAASESVRGWLRRIVELGEEVAEAVSAGHIPASPAHAPAKKTPKATRKPKAAPKPKEAPKKSTAKKPHSPPPPSDDFSIQHREIDGTAPDEGPHYNTFVPDPKLAKKHIAESRRLSKKRKGVEKERRDPPPRIHVTCEGCGKEEDQLEIFVPKKADTKDKQPKYYCFECGGGRR